MKPLDILIKFPCRWHPELFKRTFAEWNEGRVRFVCSFDEDDPSTNNPDFRNWIGQFTNVRACWGRSRTKVEAINADLEGETFDVLILASDDMHPQVPHCAERLAYELWKAFPGGDGVLHVNTGLAGDKLNTIPIMGKRYYDRFGYIYHPQYRSLWCDNEFTDVSQSLGCVYYIPEILVRHLGLNAAHDQLVARNNAFLRSDGEIYAARRAAGFPPSVVTMPTGKPLQEKHPHAGTF